MSKSNPVRAGAPHGSLRDLSVQLGPVEYQSTSNLKSYPRNPRRHPEKQICKLAASIREFGFLIPVLLNRRGEIVAGAARVEAAKSIGLSAVPTLCINHLSDAQARAFRIADNRLAEFGEWDIDLLTSEIQELFAIEEFSIDVLGWDTPDIDVMLDASVADGSAEADLADEIVEPAAEPISRPGDLWRLGRHRLLCASSLDVNAWVTLLAGEKARMAFTDPPYNVPVGGHVCGLGKIKHAEFAMASGEMSEAEFTAFLTEILERISDHCMDGAILDVCIDWRHLFELQSAVRASKLSLLNLCVWAKTNGDMGSLYGSQHELVLILKKGKAAHVNNVELGRHGRYRTNVWHHAGVNSFGRSREEDLVDHPTVKPIALVAEAIRDVTAHGDIVLDAFTGSGTTLLAAERTGRRGFGIEIEPRYVDVAIRRWEKVSGEQAVLDTTGATFEETAEERRAANAASAGLSAAA